MTGIEENRLNKRWGLVAIAIVAYLCLGAVYSWSVFREPLEAVLGGSPDQSGIPYSVFLGSFAFSMPLGGVMMSRIGHRPTLLVGGLLLGTGWVSSGLAEQLVFVTVTFGLLGGFGVGLAYGVLWRLSVVGFPTAGDWLWA